jgi:steroid delta-isomerase
MNETMALDRLVRFYETIDRYTLRQELAAVYAPDARFKDPFNEVVGIEAITAIFAHMFEQVGEPRFVVTTCMQQGAQACLVWEFHFRMKRFMRGEQCIRGASHVAFDGAGRVTMHRDYWDSGEELYEKLPLLGLWARCLRRVFQKR